MALLRIDDPAVEPVSLEESKLHLRLDTNDDDTLVVSLITAARMHVEQLLGRVLITQTWREVRDCWPLEGSTVRLSLSPVQDVLKIRVFDAEGASSDLPADAYFVDRVSEPARLCPIGSAMWTRPGRALNGIEIEFVAGYGNTADDVPHPLRQAILLLAAHWYEQRTPVDADEVHSEIPQTVAGLLAPYRLHRIA